MKHLELGFIGFGLIGGSIARALKKKKLDITISVYSRRKNPELEIGFNEGIIDNLKYEIDGSFSSCDIIFLCAPVLANLEFLPILKDILSPECILTDVGSVKGNICRAAAELGLSRQFIGGHPMAGSEKTGYGHSTDTLLENAYYLLTPTSENSPEDIGLLQELVRHTGAECVVLSPAMHDKITAVISHVPHIIAASLVNLVRQNDDREENMKAFAAGGFRDITRIASSSPAMWRDICLANSESIDSFLACFESQLQTFRNMLSSRDAEGIYSAFQTAGDYRDSIPKRKSTMFARSYELFVNIDDYAGSIAAVATILSENGISIKNIGIINNREYADGVLKLDLYSDEDAWKAKRLLEKKQYDIAGRK